MGHSVSRPDLGQDGEIAGPLPETISPPRPRLADEVSPARIDPEGSMARESSCVGPCQRRALNFVHFAVVPFAAGLRRVGL